MVQNIHSEIVIMSIDVIIETLYSDLFLQKYTQYFR